jgi:hypothetical protein
MVQAFQRMTDSDYEVMFNTGIEKLKERSKEIEIQLEKLTRDRDRFKGSLHRIDEF